MSLELMTPDLSTKPAFPGNKGFLVLAKLRGMRNVQRESLKRLRALTVEYCKAKYPEEIEKAALLAEAKEQQAKEEEQNKEEEMKEDDKEAEEEKDKESKEEKDKESKDDKDNDPNAYPDSVIKFGPHEMMYENCCFIVSNLVNPSDYAHFCFSKMADDKSWPNARFPLRIMPVQEICCLSPRAIEISLRPLLEEVFSGEEAIRFSIVFHGKIHQDSKEMPRQVIEAIVRNIIWSINPNCVQCIKHQDYAVLLEVVDPMLFVGIAKEFNQLGRYNTNTVQSGRDLKDVNEEDSEDEISDDPELSEADNIKKKLKMKKKRRVEKEEQQKAKQVKIENGGGDNGELAADVDMNGN